MFVMPLLLGNLGSFAESNQQGLWFVSTTGGDDTNNCATPQSPCLTIPKVLGLPTFVEGDTIRVTSGSFPYSEEPFALILDKDVMLSGGWDATFSGLNGFNTSIEGKFGGLQILASTSVSMETFSVHGDADFAIQNEGTLAITDGIVWSENYSGINNNGFLALTAVRLRNSFGIALVNYGYMAVNDVVIAGNRFGGVANHGTMIILNSVVDDFGDWFTTAIGNSGTLTIQNSVIIDSINPYTTPATALYNTGSTTFINTTITRSSGGDTTIFNAGGADLHFYNSTFAFNGSGIENAPGGVVTLQNSILAQNGGNCTGDPIQSLGFNLIDDTTGCTIISTPDDILNIPALIFPVKGNAAYAPPANEEALFAPLAFSSPAVNGGNPAGCFDDQGAPILTDQRGLPRSGACDIGAYEYIAAFDPLKYLWLPAILNFSP